MNSTHRSFSKRMSIFGIEYIYALPGNFDSNIFEYVDNSPTLSSQPNSTEISGCYATHDVNMIVLIKLVCDGWDSSQCFISVDQ